MPHQKAGKYKVVFQL